MDLFFDEFQHLKLQLEEIKSATDNFADDKAIGNGGFGKVNKGEISHSKGRSTVAFKRLNSRYGQGNSEFWKEIMMLSRYTHENLVSLLGFCDEGGEKIIVYEYASRGSLDSHLSSTTLTWMQRIKICLGVAKGLSYLHDPMGTQQRVLHRDIKSSNILLDENWNAKVSDFGLSKIGPANLQYTAVVSNVVGTLGYLDPLYVEYGVLTKESDVYSFGLVLFEALCGRLCFEYSNGQCQSLVPLWKQNYEQNKLDEIIFQDLMQQMDMSSLETFSDIAYQCLQTSREQRPLMAHVVERLKIALQFQEIYEVMELPKEYGAIIKTATTPLIFRSEEELKRLLSEGILVNGGKTWFSRDKNGEHCELISARECLNVGANECTSKENSRFVQGNYLPYYGRFKARARTRFLSPGIVYTVNLVFKFFSPLQNSRDHTFFELKYQLGEETESSTSYLAYGRENGWMMVELYQFTSDSTRFDLGIHFESLMYDLDRTHLNIIIEGIEFRPLEKVEDEVVEDEKVDMEPTSDSDVYWEQKLPNDYKQIIKRSKDTTKWTTKKELYHLFCKGFLISKRNRFLINNGHEEWFSLAKNGKKCLMLPSTKTLVKSDWDWKHLRESRFKEVALNCHAQFRIICKIKSQVLSPQTTYACYLIYKITENHSEFVPPMRVVDKKLRASVHHLVAWWYIYLLSPQTRVINPKDGQNTHNPSNISKVKGLLPQLRNDGWMEVHVWEFRTDITTEMISMHFVLTSTCDTFGSFDGLIVQGIEFKPL
ncbi:hypothetical protein L6452_32181 [Arctium lappa]|uniref:Uncharacterized protein n=1 Tax=Arctium lappa TaxID=4217 RepID=A0ACB8Z489_ARCLA|nr:hypothetical protein L6452_32181 [Arctium lappa]